MMRGKDRLCYRTGETNVFIPQLDLPTITVVHARDLAQNQVSTSDNADVTSNLQAMVQMASQPSRTSVRQV